MLVPMPPALWSGRSICPGPSTSATTSAPDAVGQHHDHLAGPGRDVDRAAGEALRVADAAQVDVRPGRC